MCDAGIDIDASVALLGLGLSVLWTVLCWSFRPTSVPFPGPALPILRLTDDEPFDSDVWTDSLFLTGDRSFNRSVQDRPRSLFVLRVISLDELKPTSLRLPSAQLLNLSFSIKLSPVAEMNSGRLSLEFSALTGTIEPDE